MPDGSGFSCMAEFIAVFKRRRRLAFPGNILNAVDLFERGDQVEVNVDLAISLGQKAPGYPPRAFCYELTLFWPEPGETSDQLFFPQGV